MHDRAGQAGETIYDSTVGTGSILISSLARHWEVGKNMPGFFGAAGCSGDLVERLRGTGAASWPGASTAGAGPGSLIGASPLAPLRAGDDAGGTLLVAWDGEALVGSDNESADLMTRTPADMMAADGIVANVAVLHPDSSLELQAHCSGAFPLYYAEVGDGMVFASQLRPLAGLTDGGIDLCGLVQFLGEGYSLMGRTAFTDIRRLLPGQRLTRTPDGAITIRETSQVWDRIDRTLRSEDDAAEEFWALLRLETVRDIALADRLPDLTLMLSGGWDSRTLLAGYLASGGTQRVRAYSHGDPESRELRLVRRICADQGVDLQTENIDAGVIEPDFLRASFARTESVIFPHWHRAGLVAASGGPVSAGVFGEIAGGHYGTAQIGNRIGKAASLARGILGLGDTDQNLSTSNLAALRKRLHWSGNKFYWYLNAEAKGACSGFASETNADIDAEIDRLIARGATTVEQLVEAFTTEHRCAQYIANQLLSCRNSRGVLFPFARTRLLEWASRVPMRYKLLNRMNRNLIKTRFPPLARYPLAATLVPGGAPLLLQESSRAVRKLWEDGLGKLNEKSGGHFGKAHLEWVRFDWLRTTPLLRELVDDLRSDIWDRRALNGLVASIRSGSWTGNLHHVFDQLGKISTADRWIRCRDRP